MFAGKEKRVWVAESERNLFKETINKVYSADKLTKIQNKKNFCGGRLFLIKSQLQPSTPRKSEVLHWNFFRECSYNLKLSQCLLLQFPSGSIHLELYFD